MADPRLDEVLETARARPEDAAAQVAAAYACDRAGDEELAVTFYDAAWRLGVPPGQRRDFGVGYGSTLRNVGRLEEAEAVLRSTLAHVPGDVPLRVFLALVLHSRGDHDSALGVALAALLDVAKRPDSLGGYARAIASYQSELEGR